MFPGIERVLGDRDGRACATWGRTWDAVVDPSGFFPRIVGASARRVEGLGGRYLFVSTISVYAEPLAAGLDETAPVAKLADPKIETITGETYGGLKALCEKAVLDVRRTRAGGAPRA